MNYEDEPYVRLYVNDTATWTLLGWEGQTVLMHMLRNKFDRAGIFNCGRHEPSQAVTAVTRLPLEVVERGLFVLLLEGVWLLQNKTLVWPNYLQAQTCARSDRLRQAESRRNRRDSALPSSPPSTPEMSQNVTVCHEMSQPSQSVTLSLALPSLALDPPVVPQGGTLPGSPKAKRAKSPEVPLPADWAPTAEHVALAAKWELSLELEVTSFRGWAEGRKAVSWNGTFTTRLANSVKWRAERGQGGKATAPPTPSKPVTLLADMTREQKDAYKQQQRDLEAWAKEQSRKQAEARELASGTFPVAEPPRARPETEDAFKGHPSPSNGAS